MSVPRISIVTICRNDLHGLRQTVASVKDQTLPPFEHLVIDGQSSDGSVEWLGTANPESYFRWRSEADDGIYDAMNKGVRATTGDWVLMLNSGDRLFNSDTLENVTVALANTSKFWAFGESEIDYGSKRGRHRLRRPGWLWFLFGLGTVPHQATFISRTLYEDVGDFRVDIGTSADQEHLLRCWIHGRPLRLWTVISVCAAFGVSAAHPRGYFAEQMALYRQNHDHLILGHKGSDRLATIFAQQLDIIRSRIRR